MAQSQSTVPPSVGAVGVAQLGMQGIPVEYSEVSFM